MNFFKDPDNSLIKFSGIEAIIKQTKKLVKC